MEYEVSLFFGEVPLLNEDENESLKFRVSGRLPNGWWGEYMGFLSHFT